MENIIVLALISVLISCLYAIAVVIAVVCMRPDHFVQKATAVKNWQGHHPFFHGLFKVLKNLAGLGIIVSGLAMLVLPGQGVLTMLIGLTLLDFPGKRRLEIWFLRRSSILNGINRIRKKARRAPLILPNS